MLLGLVKPSRLLREMVDAIPQVDRENGFGLWVKYFVYNCFHEVHGCIDARI